MVPEQRAEHLSSPAATRPGAQSAAAGGTLALIVETMRPRQWSKNAFVFAGVLFSGRVLELDTDLRALVAVAAFCAVSGAAYLVNDAADAALDRLNPRTANRPIARGDLSPRTARIAAAVATAVALGAVAFLNWETLAVLAGFGVLQAAYSHWLKHVLFIDVMTVAAGFVLRALAGLVAIGAVISPWFLLGTGLLALFLGLAKRRGEIVALAGADPTQRPVLEGYSVGLLDELIAVVTPTALVVYALYGVLGARSQAMLVTLPFVLYGIFRCLFLIHHRSSVTEDPAEIVWRDRPLLVCIVCWGICAGIVGALST